MVKSLGKQVLIAARNLFLKRCCEAVGFPDFRAPSRSAFWLTILFFLLPHVEGAMAQQAASQSPLAAVELTKAERTWLAGKHTVRARVADYPPYMLTQPEPSGISVDYLSAIAKRFGFKVDLVPDKLGFSASVQDVMGPRQQFDVILTFTRSPEREKQFAITVDYLTAPWVVYARRDSPYIIKANRLDNLVVTAPTHYGINTQAMAVRSDWPELAGLINKGIAAMPVEERNAISRKWGGVEFRPRIDFTLVWQIAVASAFIVLAFLYRNRQLAREIARRKKAELSVRETAAQLSAERDLLERRVSERTAELSDALESNETMLLNSPLPMGIYAESGQCVMANEAYARFVGTTPEVLLAQNFREIAAWQRSSLLGDCLVALDLQTSQQREAHTISSFGKDVWFEYRILPRHLKGQVHLLIQFFDLTERKRMEEELRHLAFHDSLTRLPNRRLLLDRMAQALRVGKREKSYLAVLFIDLDRFKQLNDGYGHDTGDRMLVEVANRLRQVVRDSDTVARIGGDEFVVLLSGLGTDSERAAQHADTVVGKIRDALSAEYAIDQFIHRGSASVGIKLLLGGDNDPDQILKEADAAMYETKKAQ
jgi:diguanylate cyclase (GGDEF)-like protein/PAS domain S-box-containing protein